MQNERMANKMNKSVKIIATISLIYSILLLVMAISIIIIGFSKGNVLLSIIIGFLYFITGTIFFRYTYPIFLIENRKSKRLFQALSDEELEIVKDAKELIKRVDNKIVISEFNVYKVRFVMHAWFYYDKDSQELNIFIPFKFFLWLGGRDFCFLAVLHEVLHSQNLKNNLHVFNKNFLEGLNQLLTIWLINNFSEKYKIPKRICFSLKLIKGLKLKVSASLSIYSKEVNMVKETLENSKVDLKQVFLRYIDIQPEFFKSFVPSEYFKKQS